VPCQLVDPAREARAVKHEHPAREVGGGHPAWVAGAETRPVGDTFVNEAFCTFFGGGEVAAEKGLGGVLV
jgi:hypothetical protein